MAGRTRVEGRGSCFVETELEIEQDRDKSHDVVSTTRGYDKKGNWLLVSYSGPEGTDAICIDLRKNEGYFGELRWFDNEEDCGAARKAIESR